VFTVAALALCASPAVPLADGCNAQTNWMIMGSGSWFFEMNWTDGFPNCATTANISNGGTATINNGPATACDVTLGINTGETGTVSMDNGVLNACSEILVGGVGKGTLTATNGSSITAGLLTIAASDANSYGTVSIDGTTIAVTSRLDVGGDNGIQGGIALLSVKNGGGISVSAGYLRVYGSGTLTGNGTVSATNGTTVEGTVSPSGTLTIGGGLTFSGTAAAMQSNVAPSGADNVHASGSATLNGRLAVTMAGTFTPGTTYTLLQADGALGGTMFSSYSIRFPTGQNFTPQITYDANHVYLYLAANTGP
jgi:hypothetical protein